MGRCTLFCVAFVSAFVFHLSTVSAFLGNFLFQLQNLYELDQHPAVKAMQDKFRPLTKKYENKAPEEAMRDPKVRKAILSMFAMCLQIGATKESDAGEKQSLLDLLSLINDGSYDAVLKDPEQWPALHEYLKTWGKDEVPAGFKSGTVQTAGFTSGFLATCFVMSLVWTQ